MGERGKPDVEDRRAGRETPPVLVPTSSVAQQVNGGCGRALCWLPVAYLAGGLGPGRPGLGFRAMSRLCGPFHFLVSSLVP